MGQNHVPGTLFNNNHSMASRIAKTPSFSLETEGLVFVAGEGFEPPTFGL